MKKNVTLSEIWEKTAAVKVKSDQTFLHMDVHSEETPISLMDGAGWLAWVYPLEAGRWYVGVWMKALRLASAYEAEGQVASIANTIFEVLSEAPEETWVPVHRPEGEVQTSVPKQEI